MFSSLKKISCALILVSSGSAIAFDDSLINENSMENPKRKYGLKFSEKKHPQPLFKLEKRENRQILPLEVDMRSECPPVYDQLNIGSCTGNACAGAVAYLLKKQEPPVQITPARLFIYYNARLADGSEGEDVGATIQEGIYSLAKYGVPPESDMPYIDNGIAFKTPPSKIAYTHGLQHVDLDNLKLARVNQDEYTIKSILAKKIPIVFGLQVYSSFEDPQVTKTGIVPVPDLKKEEYLGGHALMMVGYNTSKKVFHIRNSWGKNWGQKGYCEIPESYILNSKLADDFWKVEKIGSKIPHLLSVSISEEEKEGTQDKKGFVFNEDSDLLI